MNDKLWKCLALTQSDNDHEALVAIRKANSIVKQLGLTWEKVLKPNATDTFKPKKVSIAQKIKSILNSNASKGCKDFVTSVNQFYIKTGSISPKQAAIIEDIYERYVNGY